jgi:two-component system phosphate regulon response regulator OmpR
MTDAGQPQTIPPNNAQAPGDDARHILVVDDDRRIRQLLRSYLSDNGFRVSTAGSAQEARRRMSGLAFDLMVLDVMMPGETGLDFTADLRGRSDIPILMLTARAEPESRIAGLEVGVDDYLPKPFEPRELLLRIANILKRRGIADQSISSAAN